MRILSWPLPLAAALLAAAPLAVHAQKRPPREELAPLSALRVDTTVYSRLRWRHVTRKGAVMPVRASQC